MTVLDFGLWTLDLGLPREGHSALATELGPWQILKSAIRTAALEGSGTLDAEFHPFGIVRAAA